MTIMDSETTMTEPATGAQPDVEAQQAKKPAKDIVMPDYLDLKNVVQEFLDTTLDARMTSERCRDYYDGRQWTQAQVEALKRRKQAPIVNNRIKVKQNGLLGLASMRKADPQAFARNQEADSSAAEAATDGLRYASEKTNLQSTMMQVTDNFFCEGYGAVTICEEVTPRGDVEVCVDHIPWDRIFFDAFSRKPDFSDARDKGYVIWMDEPDIEDAFPDADPSALVVGAEVTAAGDTFDDKPSWYIAKGIRKRHLVATHYFKRKGTWYMAIYTGSGYLLPPIESPYLDEYGQPECPMEIVSAYTDRFNMRYGELVAYIDLQDEINHRRSKMLHLLSQRQTFANRGAVKDVKRAKRELAKPDGHLEVGQGEFGKDFGIIPTTDMSQGQMELLQEAKGEIDAQGYNAQLAGQRQQGDLSGIAIGKLQNAGALELNRLFDNLTFFRLRVYRQMWNRIRQFWNQEKWVRVTDDQSAPRYVGFNVQITMGDFLQEIIKDASKPIEMRVGAQAKLQELSQNPQALQQIIMTKNKPAELDMDIILDESYDVINASQEQLDAIIKFGAQNNFDIIDLLEISNVIGKKRLIEKIEQRRQEQAAQQQQNPQLQLMAAKTAEIVADTKVKTVEAQRDIIIAQADVAKTQAQAEKTAIETEILKVQGATAPFQGKAVV